MNKKLTQLIHSALFILTIAGVGIVSLLNKPFDFDKQKLNAILSGETARALETNYDDELFIKEFGVNLWAAVEYKLFNEGKDGLVIGKDGWLFTAEEFKVTEHSEQALMNNIDLIKWVNDEFKKHNVTLVVVPVPAKARIYDDKLIATKPNALHQHSYQKLFTELNQHSVHVTDSYTAMRADKTSHEQFLRTDTHWTPAGANTVAHNTAHYINVSLNAELNSKTYITELKETTTLKGDLFNYLPLSPWFDSLLPNADELAVYETFEDSEEAQKDDMDDLFGETTENIALVGTSYSANPNWNFVGALKQAMATDIINYAQEGHGPVKPMMQFLETYQTEMPDLELVIWEIPERYLSVAYNAAYAKRESMQINATLIAKKIKPNLTF